METGSDRLSSDGDDSGYYAAPTVFSEIDNDSGAAQEESFGPVPAVIRADDFKDALANANDVAYGLSARVSPGSERG